MTATNTTAEGAPTAKRLRIDFLFLDLTTCDRCRATDRNLEQALEVARDLLAATGTEVEVNKIHVETAQQARELRLESSPTIRVNDTDIALELRESPCGAEACTDGCGGQIGCRVWVHDGRDYTEPPLPLILDAILHEVYAGPVEHGHAESKPYELPDNLARFFAGKAATSLSEAPAQAPLQADCCSPAHQRSCCDHEDKAECCGASTAEGCGCR